MQEIIVTAYPKSGITWLIHMLCDLLDSPQQNLPGEPLQWWGDGRDGGFVIRKRHTPYVPALDGQTVVFTQRDPRDVLVSAAHYRDNQALAFALLVVASETEHEAGWTGNYADYIQSWMDGQKFTAATRYEWLHDNPVNELNCIARALGVGPVRGKARQVAERHTFDKMALVMNDSHFMRKGIVGDWRNHFSREFAREFDEVMGEFMLEQGYITSRDWWEELG